MKGTLQGMAIVCAMLSIHNCLLTHDLRDFNSAHSVELQEPASKCCCEHQKHQAEDVHVQQMAIQTMANMANNLVQIGADPHNPQVVGSSIVNILGSFVNFVIAATRHPELIEILQNQEFQDIVAGYVLKTLDMKSDETDTFNN